MSSVKQALSEAADIYHLIGIEYHSSSCYLLTLREYVHCLSISLIGVCPREVSRLLQRKSSVDTHSSGFVEREKILNL